MQFGKAHNCFFLLALGLVLSISGITQTRQTPGNKYYVEHFGEEEGLPQNSINNILPDKNDFLWIATEGGITRFNGNRFLNVPIHKNAGVNLTRIKSFYLKGKDSILAYSSANYRVATIVKNKIVAVDRMTYRKYGLLFLNQPASLPVPEYISAGDSLSNSIIGEWNVDKGGYNGAPYNKDTFMVILLNGIGFYDSRGKLDEVKIINLDERDVLFSGRGFIHLDEKNYLNYYTIEGLQKRQLLPIPSKRRPKIFSNIFGNNFFCVVDSTLYTVNISGLSIGIQQILTNLQHPEDISVVYQKDSNTILAGTLLHGLYVYKKQFFQTTPPLSMGETEAFYGQTVLPDNQTILVRNNLLFRKGNYIGKTKTDPVTDIYGTLRDKKGYYWYVFSDYILRAREIGVKPDTMAKLSNSPGLLYEDNDGRIFAFSGSHFGYFENDKFTQLKFDSSNLNFGNISFLCQDQGGRYLIGTREGLFILNSIKRKTLKEVPEFKSLDIRFIWPESNGQTWVCTYGNGFFLISKEAVISFPESNTRLAYVHCIIEDSKGYFWIPTNNGLFVTSRESLMAYVQNKNELPFYYRFSKKHGLRTNEFNGGGRPPYLRWQDGNISLATMQGLVGFNPNTINFDFSSSPILVDNIELDSTEIPQWDEFDINSNTRNIIFSLSSSFWGEKENDLLEYKVIEKGKSPDEGQWLSVDASGKIHLFSLSHGNYQLVIRKRKGLGKDDYLLKTIHFYVLPKWYQTKAFAFASILGILLIMTALFFFRRRYYRRVNRILQQKVNAATGNLQQMNDTLEKKVEERTLAIQEAETKFRTLVEGSLVGVYIVQDKKFVYTNPTFEKILGYESGELAGVNTAQIIIENQRHIALDKIRKRMSGEVDSVHYEITGVKKDGTHCQLEFFGSKTFYEGKPTLIGTMLDITERTKMETELREAETKFRDLVEKSLVGVYIIRNGKFAYVNPRFAEIFGYSQQELTDADSVDIIVYEPDRKIVADNIRLRIEGNVEGIQYEIRGVTKKGVVIYTELFGRTTQFEGDLAIIGTLIDITAKKIAEEQLIKEKDLSQSIINNLPGIFYIFDQEGQYQLWNKNHEIVTGYSRKEMKALRPQNVIAVDEHSELAKPISKVFTEGYAELEATLVSKHGKRIPYYFNGIAINYNDRACVMGVGIDISERKKAEKEKDHANYMLNERIKELTTLYRAGLILQREERSILITLNEFVNVLPSGWQYDKITEARVTLGELEFTTAGFKIGQFSQSASFNTSNGNAGKIEVVYLEERPTEEEGPFLAEERKLIDMLADMLRIYFTKREAIAALQKSEANLHTIFDTTDTVYVLLNEHRQVIAFNQRAADFSEKEFKKALKLHTGFADYLSPERQEDITLTLQQVLGGSPVNYEVSYPQPGGTLNWYHIRMFPITNAEKKAFGLMVAVSDITETKKMEQEILDQKVQKQKMVVRAILTGEERERNKIGQELHDNVNQILAGTKLYLSMAREAKTNSHNMINESMELIDSAIDEIRALSRQKVTPLKKVDLEDLLQVLIDRVRGTTDIDITFECIGADQSLEDDLKLNIYRIIQEQLNNILKHAMAQHVTVLVDAGAHNIRVLVKDDGKGFDTKAKKKGIGLANMTNRVESFNGSIVIETSPGNGCRIEINLPY